MHRWIRSVADIAVIVALVVAAKTAIAEPYYVPSGSMEPTLQIGDELLATKFPYGYSSASLPVFVTLPESSRILGALPHRGDVVVFRWPGDRSQIWVKRVVGLPGDRIEMKDGRLWINGADGRTDVRRHRAERIRGRHAGAGRTLHRDPARRPRAHDLQAHDDRPIRQYARAHGAERAISSSWATIATIPPTAASRSIWAASGCCRCPIWSAASMRWSARGIWRRSASRSGNGRRRCGCRVSSPR